MPRRRRWVRTPFLMGLWLVWVGCGPMLRTRPCKPLPVPSASRFERCGGMVHTAGPGSKAAYTIELVNEVGPSFELVDVCVLLDGAPVFTQGEIDERLPKAKKGKGSIAWQGRIGDVRHTVEIQVTYRLRATEGVPDPTKNYSYFVRAAQEIAPVDGATLQLIVREDEGAPIMDEDRLTVAATLPKGTAQPRCE